MLWGVSRVVRVLGVLDFLDGCSGWSPSLSVGYICICMDVYMCMYIYIYIYMYADLHVEGFDYIIIFKRI